MAEIYENRMTVTAPELTDYLRLVTENENSRRTLLSALSALILEDYAGTTLAGTAQSIQAAVDALSAAISSEVNNRGNAVSGEATARQQADNALGESISGESTARASADTALGNQISAIETAIYIGSDGKCYANLKEE